MKNKVVREIIEFIKGHQLLFDQILQEDLSDANELTMEIINLVVGILSKVKINVNKVHVIAVFMYFVQIVGCISCIIDAN